MSSATNAYTHKNSVVKVNHQLMMKYGSKLNGKRPTKNARKGLGPTETIYISLWTADFIAGAEIVEFRFFANIDDKENGRDFWTYVVAKNNQAPKGSNGLKVTPAKPGFVITHDYDGPLEIPIYYGILVKNGACFLYLDPELVLTKDGHPIVPD